jgi:hypothetical protein
MPAIEAPVPARVATSARVAGRAASASRNGANGKGA